MSKWIEVSKEDFIKILIPYPSQKLTSSIVRICTPEICSYDDFSDGKVWPESTVAQEILHEWYKDTFTDAKNVYRIKKEHYERLINL
jgi:hypothetical protein